MVLIQRFPIVGLCLIWKSLSIHSRFHAAQLTGMYAKNKRGMFFTIFVIIVLSLFIVAYTFYSEVQERKTIQKRIETMNNFLFSIEENIPRQLRATGFRIIFLFEKRIAETGSYITDLNETFNEMFFNGTIYGQTNPEIQAFMQGATLSGIISTLQENANKINAEVDITNPSISISQEGPWFVKIILNANIMIKDRNNLAFWNKTANIAAYVSVDGFEDPFYIINTNGLVTNKIIKTPYENFVSGSDISNFSAHSENSYYISSVSAPSFLNRLEGINAPNANGIESLVNLQKLSSQGIEVKDKTVVDYIYFSDNSPSACSVAPSGMPAWFKLDNSHLLTYQVSCFL